MRRVKFDFEAQQASELSVKVGELVSPLGDAGQGWLNVKVSRTGPKGANVQLSGLVPASYLDDPPSAPSVARAAPSAPGASRVPIAAVVAEQVHNVALEHAECAICFDEMVERKCAVLLSANRKRSCRHFLHKVCADGLLQSGQQKCPICRAPFVASQEIPSFDQSPAKWFECVDANGDGTLSKSEVLEILKATMAIDYRALEKNVDTLWPRWDKDGSGEIDFGELCDPKIGLLVYVRSHFARKKREPPPKLEMRNLEIWFTYWDDSDNGSLEKEEILRALIKTFSLSTTPGRMKEMRDTLDAIWPLFDSDGSGEIELGEFIQRDGLGESLCASVSTIR